MTLRVEVTAEDIATGVRRDCQRCPLALALARTLGGTCRVGAFWPYGWYCWVVNGGCLPLPEETASLARDFDAGREVQPCVFKVQV